MTEHKETLTLKDESVYCPRCKEDWTLPKNYDLQCYECGLVFTVIRINDVDFTVAYDKNQNWW